MEIKAKAKHIRISPRKVRLVVDIIRGLEVNKALDQLQHVNKQAVRPLIKLIKSSIANAEHNFELDKNNLKITEIRVDEGPTLHRWMPRAHGRATPVRKRTSHISLTLAEIKVSGAKKAKKLKIEEPIKMDSKPKEEEGLKLKSEKDKKESVTKISRAEKEKGLDKGDKIIDPRMEGRGGHTKVEGGKRQGFASRFFRRKSG